MKKMGRRGELTPRLGEERSNYGEKAPNSYYNSRNQNIVMNQITKDVYHVYDFSIPSLGYFGSLTGSI